MGSECIQRSLALHWQQAAWRSNRGVGVQPSLAEPRPWRAYSASPPPALEHRQLLFFWEMEMLGRNHASPAAQHSNHLRPSHTSSPKNVLRAHLRDRDVWGAGAGVRLRSLRHEG